MKTQFSHLPVSLVEGYMCSTCCARVKWEYAFCRNMSGTRCARVKWEYAFCINMSGTRCARVKWEYAFYLTCLCVNIRETTRVFSYGELCLLGLLVVQMWVVHPLLKTRHVRIAVNIKIFTGNNIYIKSWNRKTNLGKRVRQPSYTRGTFLVIPGSQGRIGRTAPFLWHWTCFSSLDSLQSFLETATEINTSVLFPRTQTKIN